MRGIAVESDHKGRMGIRLWNADWSKDRKEQTPGKMELLLLLLLLLVDAFLFLLLVVVAVLLLHCSWPAKDCTVIPNN